MNKKLNSVLFMLGATLLNVALMAILFTGLFLLFAATLGPLLPGEVVSIVALLLFFASLVLTYFLYHRLIRLLARRFDLEAYFDPLFRRRGK